jgi:hypothetical protein
MISLYWNWIKDSIFTFLVTCSFYMMFNSDLALVFSIFRSMFRGSLGSSMFRLSFFGEVYRFSNLFSNHQLCRFGMAVWSTMSHMCTMRCLPTSIEIMWHSRALPSKFPWKFFVFYKLSLLFYVFSSLFCYMLLKLIHNIFFSNRFFKESSIEEREHAEKLMEYQVIKFII